MIKLAYHFKCDITGCPVESKDNIGDVNYRMSIPDIPIPRGWHYLDHRIVCDGHSIVIDKKWIDAPEPKIIEDEPFVEQPASYPGPTPIKKKKKK